MSAPRDDAGDAALLARFDAVLDSAAASSSSSSSSAAASARPPSTATPFSLLSEVFPAHSARAIRAALTANAGDAQAAADALTAAGASPSAPAPAPTSTPDALRAEARQRALWEDAARARARAPASTPDVTVAAARSPPVARRPRALLTDDPAAPAPPQTHRQFQAGSGIALVNRRRPGASPTLSPAVRRHVVRELKDVIVPSLRAHFAEITFRDYKESEPGYSFSLTDVAVAALSLPEESVMVGAVAGGFRVNVVNGFLELDIGRWRYQSRRLFGFDDGGGARVTAHGLTASAMLVPRLCSPSAIAIDVGDVDVTVEGAFRLRTEGTSADWAYNAAAVVLKPLVISYVKAAVREVILAALTQQLKDWTAWSADDEEAPERRLARSTMPRQAISKPAVVLSESGNEQVPVVLDEQPVANNAVPTPVSAVDEPSETTPTANGTSAEQDLDEGETEESLRL